MALRQLPDPPLTSESEPFFAAAREGRFLIRRCAACERAHWYPRPACPFCFGETRWEEASGRGTIYSYSIMRRVQPPYAIAYVTLAEGPTMLTNLVGCDFDRVAIGQSVEHVFTPSATGIPVPCFRPSTA
jgi:uncharacterized OB-fold protein